MERRLYFVVGDFAANAAVGTAAVALSTWLVGGAWGMVPGMLAGMVLGTIVGLVLSLAVLSPLLGALEILVPCTLSGMLAGMRGGMRPLAGSEMLCWGAGIGVAVVVVVYALNAALVGPRRPEA